MYGIRDIVETRRLTKLRIEFSKLNEHRFRHNFDCVSPFCYYGMEDIRLLLFEKSAGTTERHYNTEKQHHVLGILKTFFCPTLVRV